ncbi:hypothetical protein [Spirosoma sp.]|uniref:hypothetical protein n=1 Tax=Spirosoma sp. TaxID=1899569 RepID=UPI003B3B740B
MNETIIPSRHVTKQTIKNVTKASGAATTETGYRSGQPLRAYASKTCGIDRGAPVASEEACSALRQYVGFTQATDVEVQDLFQKAAATNRRSSPE